MKYWGRTMREEGTLYKVEPGEKRVRQNLRFLICLSRGMVKIHTQVVVKLSAQHVGCSMFVLSLE